MSPALRYNAGTCPSCELAFLMVPNWLLLRGVRLCWRRLRHMLLHRRDQSRKSFGILHGHVRQNLAVEVNAAGLQRVNQLAVGCSVIARGCADALNPKRAVIAFAHAAVAIGVTQRAIHRLFRRAEELSLGEEKSLGVLQQLFAAGAAFGSTFNSRHDSVLLWRSSMALSNQVRRQTRPTARKKSASSRTGLSHGAAICTTQARHF